MPLETKLHIPWILASGFIGETEIDLNMKGSRAFCMHWDINAYAV